MCAYNARVNNEDAGGITTRLHVCAAFQFSRYFLLLWLISYLPIYRIERKNKRKNHFLNKSFEKVRSMTVYYDGTHGCRFLYGVSNVVCQNARSITMPKKYAPYGVLQVYSCSFENENRVQAQFINFHSNEIARTYWFLSRIAAVPTLNCVRFVVIVRLLVIDKVRKTRRFTTFYFSSTNGCGHCWGNVLSRPVVVRNLKSSCSVRAYVVVLDTYNSSWGDLNAVEFREKHRLGRLTVLQFIHYRGIALAGNNVI